MCSLLVLIWAAVFLLVLLHVLCLPSVFTSALCEVGTLPCHARIIYLFRYTAKPPARVLTALILLMV